MSIILPSIGILLSSLSTTTECTPNALLHISVIHVISRKLITQGVGGASCHKCVANIQQSINFTMLF